MIVLISQSDIVNRRNPYIELKNLHQENPIPTLLTAENFRLQFGLYGGKSFTFIPVDPTIFSITAIKIKSSQAELMKPITAEITNLEYKQDPNLPLYSLEDNDIILEGSIQQANGTYIQVSLFFCDNVTSNNTCKSQEEMNTFLLGKSFAIFYRDSSINFDDYDDPLKFSENTETMLIDPNLTKQYTLNIKKGDFIDDKGIFFKQIDDTKAMINKDDANFDFASHVPGDELAYFFIALSRNTQRVTRSYPKIGELFSSLLVVYNLFTFFGTILMKRFRKVKIFDYIFEEKIRENKTVMPPKPESKTNFSMFMKFKKKEKPKINTEQLTPSAKGVENSVREIIQFFPENLSQTYLKIKNWLAKKKKKERDFDKQTNLRNFFQALKRDDGKKNSNLTKSEYVVKKKIDL